MKNFNHTNRLAEETSPFLFSHAHQLIDWYPWSEEALNKAKAEGKLLFISVGYSACHWCHTMSKECFDSEAVADVLNKHYISILIDKEERPDLDQLYLNIVQIMTDNAGWPLSCFALHDGTPVFSGTYLTSSQFIDIAKNLQYVYHNQFEKVREVADDVLGALKNVDVITTREASYKFLVNDVKLIVEPWKRKFDKVNGGTQKPPKFPLPVSNDFLMWSAYYFNDESIKKHLLTTLDKMAQGAIFDQIGGGFFRYTIDAEWKIPHFEKMLYDNAQLASLYAKAYRFTKNERYKEVAESTINFMLREMSSENGAFYCSIDSDNTKGEGEYYMWSMQEFKDILQDDAGFATDYFGIFPQGAPTDVNILFISKNEEELVNKYLISITDVQHKISSIKQKLFEVRNKRNQPLIDKKIIASWNGLAITSLLNLYVAFNNDEYLEAAKKTAQYIKNELMYDGGRIYRCITSKTPIKGFLDDYAFVIKAFISLFQLTGDKQYINDAKKMADYVIEHFYEGQSGMFFFTSDEHQFPLGRKMDFVDRAVASSCSEFMHDLMLLAYIYNDEQYFNYSRQMLASVKPQMSGAGPFVSNWAKMLFYYIYEPIVVKVSSKTLKPALQSICSQFLPNIIILPSLTDNNEEESIFAAKVTKFTIREDPKFMQSDIELLAEVAIINKQKKLD